jgi:hypothetical protein
MHRTTKTSTKDENRSGKERKNERRSEKSSVLQEEGQ